VAPHAGPEANLAAALRRLAELPDMELAGASPVYVTEPQELKDQPWFHNQVVRLRAGPSWTPERLLVALKGLEADLGRTAGVRFGPRVIDLDLLLFGRAVLDTPALTLPHPRLRRRAFVLVPLRDVAPGLIFPDGGTLEQALADVAFALEGRTIRQP